MKKLILFFAVIICSSLTTCGQRTEFTMHNNGLIYDEATMSKLGHIVDSLNIRFKTCDVKNYTSLPQGYAICIYLKKHNPKAIQALRNNISPDDFVKAFPKATIRKKEWIIKTIDRDYEGEKTIIYFSLPQRNKEEIRMYLPITPENDKTSGWVYHEDTDYGLTALFLHGLKQPALPSPYARLVQYVDCMIDTTAHIYLEEKPADDFTSLTPDSKVVEFLGWANDFDGKPERPEINWDKPEAETILAKYERAYKEWDNARLAALDKKMQESDRHKTLLREAATEAVENKIGDDELEFYIERYLSPAMALQMKRSRRPIGGCSMDSRPREHAANICRLAAATTQWDIFLRAHLDIMNDNFARGSDGSWAWAGRGTYLKELEELDINAVDLLIGSCLRTANVHENHYLGNIGRIGRALAESQDNNTVENRLLVMIADDQLDLFNRLLIAYVFDHYNHHLKDESRKKTNDVNFKKAVATLPMEIGETF